jgi:uncharacterized protein (TIGR03067 family)
VQFLVQGFGDNTDFNRRLAIQDLVGGVLSSNSNGESTGGDGGSGTMNAFFDVTDPARAREPVLAALREANQLDGGLVVVHQTFRDEEITDEVWWPADYAFAFTTFGPMWRGLPGEEELASLSDAMRLWQGRWSVPRYDAPDGSDASAWAAELMVLVARDQILLRRGMAVISAGRIQIATPGQFDLRPVMGPNKGGLSVGVYEMRGDRLHLCLVPPGYERPARVAPDEEHQPGRMILQRVAD